MGLRAALFILLSLGLAQAQPQGTAPLLQATQQQLQAAFAAEAVIIGTLDSSIFVDRYEPGGWVRGLQRGRRSARRWRIEGDRLCSDPEGPGRNCAIVRVGPAGLVDHALLWLRLDNGFGTEFQAVFRVPALARPLPVGLLRGRVVELFRDGMVVRRQGGGPDVWVWSRPVHGLWPDDGVTLRGRSDGLMFTATGATPDARR